MRVVICLVKGKQCMTTYCELATALATCVGYGVFPSLSLRITYVCYAYGVCSTLKHKSATSAIFELNSANMHDIEERLVEEIRKYEHLYDSSSPDYKDSQMVADAWCEISEAVGLSVTECTKRWKNLRDKYVRLRKKQALNGDIGRKKVPAFYLCLSWLAPYVKHRDVESNCDEDNEVTSWLFLG